MIVCVKFDAQNNIFARTPTLTGVVTSWNLAEDLPNSTPMVPVDPDNIPVFLRNDGRVQRVYYAGCTGVNEICFRVTQDDFEFPVLGGDIDE